MKRIEFEDFKSFVCEINKKYRSEKLKDDYNDVSIICKYDTAKVLIAEFIRSGYGICSLNIHDEEWDGYGDEYIVTVCNIYNGDEVYCEPMIRDDRYISCESNVIYVFDDCSSKLLKFLESDEIYEVSVMESDKDEDTDESCAFNPEFGCGYDCCTCEHYDYDDDCEDVYDEFDDTRDIITISKTKSEDCKSVYVTLSSDRLTTAQIQSLFQELHI